MVMRRSLILALVVALAALVFAPAAFAQDDNPTGDDLGGDDRGGERAFDDNPTGDDLMASPSASAAGGDDDATATGRAGAGGDDDVADSVGGSLPDTGGISLLSGAAGVLFLVGSGITAAMLLRRTP
jgi:hypothetical protein